MKKLNIERIFKQNAGRIMSKAVMTVALLAGALTSCNMTDEFKIASAGALSMTATQSSIVLNQKQDAQTAVEFDWSTGTNNGTGASISYQLQVDKKGDNFATPIKLDMGKGIYARAFTVAALNDSLLTHWNAVPGSEIQLEARVISTIYTTPTTSETSNIVELTVTPYQPVSKTLYLLGSAAPNGWSADKASVMTPSASDPTVFVYQGALSVGEYKFITSLGQFLPSYNKGADDGHIVYRTLDSQADDKFSITEAAVYKVIVSLLDMTTSVVKLDLPAYSAIYMVGSAAPNGWDITKATQLVQNPDNLFEFTYTGVMQAGEFKFPVNRNADWGQDMFMRTDDTHMYLHKGGASDDKKWTIAKKGYYTIKLNLLDNTISINRLKLYMVGSATPIGWDISNAVEMTEDATDGCIFTYTGPMVSGEFKFPVNRDSSWGQDMYMRTDDTHMYLHKGGSSGDDKWNITAAGDYVIKANVETLSISIVKQ